MKELIIWFVLLFTTSCQMETNDPIDKQTLIAIEVNKKLEKYEKTVLKKCREQVLEDAVLVVDSILIARAKAQRDTSSKPPKPDKPDRPAIIAIEDTSEIAPLLPLEEEIDSLNNK